MIYNLQAIEDIVTDKKVRAHFLSSIILTDKPDSVWRINMVSYMSNPNMMLASPTLDDAVFKGEALFINGDRSQYVSRDHEKAILKVFFFPLFHEKEFCNLLGFTMFL